MASSPGLCCAGQGLAVGASADFHDHEDFSTVYSIKVFAIMKISLLSSD
jgi:hypothetical protein